MKPHAFEKTKALISCFFTSRACSCENRRERRDQVRWKLGKAHRTAAWKLSWFFSRIKAAALNYALLYFLLFTFCIYLTFYVNLIFSSLFYFCYNQLIKCVYFSFVFIVPFELRSDFFNMLHLGWSAFLQYEQSCFN